MSSALVQGSRCYACRRGLIQSFMSLSGVPIPQPVGYVQSPMVRTFSSASHLTSEISNLLPRNTGLAAEIQEHGHSSSAASQPVPWYLQVEQSAPSPHPLPHRQEIPAVPENSPTILKDVLEYLAIEAGLDDLCLLDLRGRDPPPALGGNLIMIIGTVRSLKHLNVSADRFCRWLRSVWKFRPYADGLLGRNELKIKLRRKARRAQRASKAGTSIEASDDGMITGWICVNVGIVEDPTSNRTVQLREEGFEGFGKAAGGTRIVVQMLTEDKRADINLEQLWGVEPKTTRDSRGDQATEDTAP